MNDDKESSEGHWFVMGVIAMAVPAMILATIIAAPVILVLAAVFIGIVKA